MAVLSRKTCGLAVKLIEADMARTKVERLFYEGEIPNSMVVGDRKEGMILNVFRALENQGSYDLLFNVIKASLEYLKDASRTKLAAALMRDGSTISGFDIVPDETHAVENKTALEQLIEKHSAKLKSVTLLHHLREAEEQFRLEKWDASIGQARNFVEQLLSDVAVAISSARHESPDLDKPVKVRTYLQSCGFFDESERKKLVDGVYGYFSEEGSHPGIGEQSAARICLSILWTFGFYVLEKFDARPA